MRRPFVFLAIVLLPLMAAPADASAIVLYENDFSTRTSVGPIGGLTTSLPYQLGNLVPTTQNGEGQDSWFRRHTGTKPITVADPGSSGNQYVAFSNMTPNPQHYGYAYQKIGSSVSEGVLRLSVDILAPNSWTANLSAQSNVALGGDLFYSFSGDYENNTASRFGFSPIGAGTAVQFAAYNGATEVAATGVTGGNWYRFIADHDLYSKKYSVNIYDLGASQPELTSAPISSPVATFSDLAFHGNSVDAITAARFVSIRNSTTAGFDNLVISKQSLSSHAYQTLTTEPTIYWGLNEPVGRTTAADAAPPIQYNGDFVGTRTLETPGPRPGNSLYGMAPANVAVGVTGNGAVQYTSLNTTAGIGAGEYSLQMWFKSTVSAWTDRRLQYLFGRGDSANDTDRRDCVFIGGQGEGNDTGKLYFGGSISTGGYGTQVLEPDQWYHLTVVRDDSADGAKVQVYLDGELEIESMTTWQGDVGDWLTIGHRPDLATYYGGLGLYGVFDEVVVWDRALSRSEVWANYASGVPEPSTWMLLALGGLCAASSRRRRTVLRRNESPARLPRTLEQVV